MARSPIGWHPEQIKAAVRMATGKSLSALSIEWGLGRKAISNTIGRPDYSAPIERRIAELLGKPAHEIWPARWFSNGEPRPRSSGFDPIATGRVRNSQNQKAA